MKKDMHVHSKYSRDSTLEVKDILKYAKKIGLDGIAITDHKTIKGGLEGLALSRDYGIEVTVGVEIETDCGEVVGYHLTEEIENETFYDVVDEIRRQGGVVSIPHPFDALRVNALDSRGFILKNRDYIDYLEINGRTLPYFNNIARKLAEKENIPLIGGSDAHFLWEIGGVYTLWDDGVSAVGNGSIKSLYPTIRTKLYKTLRV